MKTAKQITYSKTIFVHIFCWMLLSLMPCDVQFHEHKQSQTDTNAQLQYHLYQFSSFCLCADIQVVLCKMFEKYFIRRHITVLYTVYTYKTVAAAAVVQHIRSQFLAGVDYRNDRVNNSLINDSTSLNTCASRRTICLCVCAIYYTQHIHTYQNYKVVVLIHFFFFLCVNRSHTRYVLCLLHTNDIRYYVTIFYAFDNENPFETQLSTQLSFLRSMFQVGISN